MKQTTRKAMQEVTPLTESDCLLVFSRNKREFNYPLHVHKEFELNFIKNAKGAQRIVGDSIETIDDLELTLITGEKLEHAWLTHKCKSTQIREITIQFQDDILHKELLNKNSFKTIGKLIDDARLGVTFSRQTIEKIQERIESLAAHSQGVPAVLSLIGILYELSMSSDTRILNNNSLDGNYINFDSRRLDKMYSFIKENYKREIDLDEVADLTKMTKSAFCRFLKKRTGKTFVDILNDIRIGHAMNMLINTTHTISEICFSCGFNNLSYFNRVFLKKKNYTPSQLREIYQGNRIIV